MITMGIFGKIAGRFRKKDDEDIYGFRSQVLSQPKQFDEEPAEPEPMEPLPTRSSFANDEFPRPPQRRFQDEFPPRNPRDQLRDLTIEPTPLREPAFERNYDMMDKLNVIEAQLSAIRSQTETINERLKNLESRMGARRY
jgi:hypothetical protein